MYDGKGFKMLSALNEHCRPNSVANAFTTLMSLFNDSIGESEEIMVFRLQFDGMVNDMVWCKVVIPQILMVFFLRSLHPCYNDLLEQFRSHYKSLDGASLDSIVADVWYHDEFKLVGLDKKLPPDRDPWAAAASAPPAVDWQGKQWNNPYEWLSKLNIDSVKWRWKRSLAGNDFCPICHRNTDKHAPASCPLLAELNLKLIRVSPPAAGPPAAAPAPAASPSPGGRSAVAYEAPASGLTGSANAPSGIVATVVEEYDSDNNFCWDGDEFGVEFSGPFCCLSLTMTVPSTTLRAIIRLLRLCLLHWTLFDYLALILWLLPPPVLSSPKPLHPSSNKCCLPLFFLSRAIVLPSLTLVLPTTCFLTSRPLSHTSLCAIFKFAWAITHSFQFLATVWQ